MVDIDKLEKVVSDLQKKVSKRQEEYAEKLAKLEEELAYQKQEKQQMRSKLKFALQRIDKIVAFIDKNNIDKNKG